MHIYIHKYVDIISQVGIDMIGLLPLTNGKETAILLPLWTTSASGQKQLPFLTRRRLEWLCFFMSCMSMILSHINIHFNIANNYLQIWLLWSHHLRPREQVCEQGEGGAAAVDRDWTSCHINLPPTEQWAHGDIQPDSPDCPHKGESMIHKMTRMNSCLQCCSHIKLPSRRQPRCHPYLR